MLCASVRFRFCIPSLISAAAPSRASPMPPKRKLAAASSPSDTGATAEQPKAKATKRVAKRVAKPKAPPPPPPGPVYDPVSMRRPPLDAGTAAFRVLTWNVAGLRALLRKAPEVLKTLVENEGADVVCLQEHKLQEGAHCEDATAALVALLPGWSCHWSCSTVRKGYSGVAMLFRPESAPLAVHHGIDNETHEGEGRVMTAEFPSFFLVNVYVPNSGEGLKRLDYRVGQWDPDFSAYVKGLEARGKPVILTGDLNCAATELDIHNPKGNLRSAGFTVEERSSFAERLLGGGFVDAFRRQHPEVVGYTYWGYRGKDNRGNNKGWRLDYYLVSEGLYESAVHDCFHLPHVLGSDHCPLGLVVKV